MEQMISRVSGYRLELDGLPAGETETFPASGTCPRNKVLEMLDIGSKGFLQAKLKPS